MLDSPTPLGEVIQASTTQFTAQSARLNDPPPLGSFVCVAPPGDARPGEADPFEAPALPAGAMYGIVFDASTSSREPNRRPSAFGLDEEHLAREQPQIHELLVTDFRCLIMAHTATGRLRLYLPERPPRLHASVLPCVDTETCALTEQFDYLGAIIQTRECTCCEEVAAAALRRALAVRGFDRDYAVQAGKELALLLRDDYDRLTWVLRKIGMDTLSPF